MTLSSLLDEYNLTLDDLRWYLARLLTDSLMTSRDDPEEITRRIWSGSLEAELYNMEELYLARLQEERDRGITDEQAIREQLEHARLLKLRRHR
ncbi:MAG: hypothetical protein V3S41_00245 [Spirochaetia bacterium]